jgi:hypothetical protein
VALLREPGDGPATGIFGVAWMTACDDDLQLMVDGLPKDGIASIQKKRAPG